MKRRSYSKANKHRVKVRVSRRQLREIKRCLELEAQAREAK